MSQKSSNSKTKVSTKKTSSKKPHFPQRSVWIGAGVGVIVLVAVVMLLWRPASTKSIPTYFSYEPAEVKALSALETGEAVDQAELYKWDQKVFDLISSNKLNDVEASRILAYLATAQYDAASLAYNAKHKYVGDLELVSKEVLCLFFVKECSTLVPDEESDALSTSAAALVTARVKTRMAQDTAQTKPYILPVGKQYWNGAEPRVGIDAGSRKPWRLESSRQFRASEPPAPDSAEYTRLLGIVQTARKNITEEQRQAVVYWAGGPGTKTPPGIWLDLADEHLQKAETDLAKVLKVRSDLAMAMGDAVISVFDSKYTYARKRPFMLDPTLQTIMPTPNHPSYPAGHATISGAAAGVLEHYYPDDASKWSKLSYEAGTSRLWGGIHFTIDNDAGFTLGKSVAEQTLKASK